MRLSKLRQFTVSGVLQAIKELQEAVESLQPRKSAGTLINHSPRGVVVKASPGVRRSGGTVAPTTDSPSRWQ